MIRNYTSSVPVATTVSRIEQKLSTAGVNGIMKEYDPKGKIAALTFSIELNERTYAIRVPANVEACFQILLKESRRMRPGTRERIMEQAERTAWKLVQEWIEIQISMIVMKQAEFLEVFMPYLWSGERKQTLFQMTKESGFKLLTDGVRK